MLFDNWFTTLDLLHHLRSKGIHAVGTIRWNCLQGLPLDANKDLMKNGAMDYHCDRDSGIIAVKWVDNSVVNLASNFAGVEPIFYNKGSWKNSVEKRKWEKKHSMSSNCSRTPKNHGR